jgi:membrane protease YdiL (CAAX protease family)
MSDEFTPDTESTPYEPELGPHSAPEPALLPEVMQTSDEPAPLFQSFTQPEIVVPKRIPHLGHLALLVAFLTFSFLIMTVTILFSVYLQSHNLSNLDRIKTDVYYILGSEAILYVVTLALSLIVFPFFWNKGFFAGIHWRAATARRLFWRLILIAVGCIALAMIDDKFLPGPKNAPIDDMFRTPGAAWLMFAFGVTFAPFFEEIAFRGFLLPALATAWDWVIEKTTGQPAPPLDTDGHPEWSISAMVAASIATSLPFALVHAQQQGWSLGPFILLSTISLILCAVRIKTRSLAASTLVHACYNFILFTSALIASGGFRHFDKM